jgi:polysaccharide chain length determinant protein (PEP-CTERM system associated)
VAENESEVDLGQTLDKALGLFIRRRWLILGAACFISLAAIGVSFQIPNQYTSDATILVDAQKVSERYVVPTTNSDVSQALEAMEHEVLSRPRLLAIIDELGLYPKEKERLAPEELITLMRKNLAIEPFAKPGQGSANTFQISFTASSPQLAQQVASRLTTLFIEQNLKTRSEQATTTTTFLHEQLEATKNKLTLQEERLRDFKMQYLGELPEQQQGNVGILSGLETQLDNVMSTRTQAQQQRLYLQSLVNERRRLGRHAPIPGVPSASGQMVTPLEAAQADLSRLQAERRTLLTGYTAQHPDVLKKDQEIKAQQSVISELKAAKPAAQPNQPQPNQPQQQAAESAADIEQDLGIVQLNSQLQANAFEIENLSKKEIKLRTEIDQYRSRLNLTPVREQQITSMQRDYDLLRQHYGDLLRKEQESQLATNLEKRQEGQQFRLADPPNLPTRPSSPKRVKISLIALFGGLVAGCGLAFLAEIRNSSFHMESDVASLALPIVIGVPRFFTPAEERNRAWKRGFEWCAGFVLLCAVGFAEYFVYRHG